MSKNIKTPLGGKRILLGVSSSIAAHRALDLASALRKKGAEVRCVLTKNVTHLISETAFDAITHQKTISTLWGSDHAGDMDHLEVTKWADLFVVCPATANTIACIAHGIAADALGTFVVAWNKSPLIIAPAMNPEMWRNTAVQRNVQLIKERGHRFIGPVHGSTACDDKGLGRLASVEEIISSIEQQLKASGKQSPLKGKRITITSGPTREFADDVRCITNPSSGKQGVALAEVAASKGAEVTLVTGPTNIDLPSSGVCVVNVITAEQMLEEVLNRLTTSDAMIFAAAVSDWKPAVQHEGKLKKKNKENAMTLELVRTPDIAAEANKRRSDDQVFVGFAAESTNLKGYAGEKMKKKGFSIVFANPINEPGAGFGSDSNKGLILRDDGSEQEVPQGSKREIAELILTELEEAMSKRDGLKKTSR